jgi:MFS family permease
MSNTSTFLFKAGAIVGSGGFIFGYDIGIIAGTLDDLQATFDLNSIQTGFAVSIIFVGAIFGGIFGGI